MLIAGKVKSGDTIEVQLDENGNPKFEVKSSKTKSKK